MAGEPIVGVPLAASALLSDEELGELLESHPTIATVTTAAAKAEPTATV
jgi:hypothetical protein